MGLVFLAFVAGAVSILSPCCLPIVPGYVSYIGGVAAQEEGNRRRVLGSAALFVLGFGVVFTILGATASALGGFLLVRIPLFAKIAGVFVIVMGFAMLGVLRIQFVSGRGQVVSQRFAANRPPRFLWEWRLRSDGRRRSGPSSEGSSRLPRRFRPSGRGRCCCSSTPWEWVFRLFCSPSGRLERDGRFDSCAGGDWRLSASEA